MKWIWALPLLVLFSCGESSSTKKDRKQKDTTSNLVDEITLINKKLVDDPNNAALYHDRSIIYLNRGIYDKSMNDVLRALSIDSLNPEYLYSKGDVFFAQMRFDEATTAFAKCLKQEPGHINANLKMAKILMYLRQYKDAIKHIDLALKTDINLAEGYFLKGVLFQYAGDSTKAASSFQTALEQKTDYYDAYVTLGLLYASRKDSLAVQYYNSALSLRPKSQEALYNLAMYYQESGKFDKAFATYNKLLDINPNLAQGHYNKGYIHLVFQGDLKNAMVQFDSALFINPNYLEAYHNRGLTYREMKKFKEARADFKTALKLDPQFELSAKELEDMDNRGER